MHENRETSGKPVVAKDRPTGEGYGHKTRRDVLEESDSGTVPRNHSNKGGDSLVESEEGRPLIKENAGQPYTYSTQSESHVSQGLAGVRKAARNNKEMKFTALLHHLTVDLLRESFYSLKRKAAPGVDGVTWQEYEAGWRIDSVISTAGSIAEHTERSYRKECTYQRATGGNARWGSRQWRTKLSNRP
jgi:hypothetical protein